MPAGGFSSAKSAAAGSGSRASAPSRLAASSPPVASPSAAPMYVQSTVRSLSCRSIATHANVRGSTSAQSASSEVLPNPGGATTRESDGRVATSVRVSRARRTVPSRRTGGCIFVAWRTGPGRLPSGFVAHAGTRPRLRALEAPSSARRWALAQRTPRSSDGPARAAHDACDRIGGGVSSPRGV